jgi:hypothetical protein
MIDETTVRLQLRFARAAHADAAAELLEVRPHARETRQHVLELGELDLQLGLARPCARREDVQYQLGAIHDALAGRVLDVLALRWRELVVEDDQRRALLVDQRTQLIDLSFPEVRGGIGPIDLLGDVADDDRARRVDELLELFEVLVDMMACRRSFPRRANE